MRALLFSFALVACAHSAPRYVNVAAVRHEILATMEHDGSAPRSIVSMGHVTWDQAVVYTQASPSGPRQEETWVKRDHGWKLEGTQVAR